MIMAIVKSYPAILAYSTIKIPGIVYQDEKGNRVFFGDHVGTKCHPDFLLESTADDYGEQSANEGRASFFMLSRHNELQMTEFVGGVFDVTISKGL